MTQPASAPRTPEVLVVGGGPAGSTVAGLLAREGHDVLVVDRAVFPRPKACGECLNPGALAVLHRLGLRGVVDALDPAPLHGWAVAGSGREARADFGGGLHGLGVPRERLDAALLAEAGRRGARLLEGARVEEVRPARGGGRPAVRLRLPHGGEATLHPRVVVGADGLRSRVARSLGVVRTRSAPRRTSLTVRVRWPEGAPARRHGRLRVHHGVTLGVAPVSADGRLGNVTVVVDAEGHRAALAADPAALVDRVLRDRLDGPIPERVAGPWASGPFRHPVTRAWAPGVVLVGDAAGYFDPFTGQGIYRALRSSELAAAAVRSALATGEEDGPDRWAALERYDRTWRREVAPGRRVQRVVDAVMGHGWLREPALGVLARGGLSAVIRVTGDAAPVSSLWNPLAWSGGRT